MNNASFGRGVFFAVLAFFLWGILPLYWKLLSGIEPLHILALRILCSLVLVGGILAARRNFSWLRVFTEPKKGGLCVLAALVISANWGLYIWAVSRGHTIEASLGYYINPLVSIMLGLLFFRERMRPLQWAAFGIAGLGVLILTILSGTLPWISLSLAMTFGVYGLLKKKLRLSALESLGAETLAAAPIGLVLLFFPIEGQGLAYFTALPFHTWVILAFCGVVTAVPLYCFARGAQILPLSTVGFTQFLAPTLQFALGLFVFGEYFPARYFIAFGFIWFAVILYVVSLRK